MLGFMLVAVLTAVVVLVVSGVVLGLTAGSSRRHAADAMTAEAGRAQVSE
jgi:hypothetical protein